MKNYINLLNCQKNLDSNNLELMIIDKQLNKIVTRRKNSNTLNNKLSNNHSNNSNSISKLIIYFLKLIKKSFIMFTCGFNLGLNKKEGLYYKKQFEKLYFLNNNRKINLIFFSKINFKEKIFENVEVISLEFLTNNPYIYIFNILGVICIMAMILKIEFYCNSLIMYIVILYIGYSLIVSSITILNFTSFSIFILSKKNKQINRYLTKTYDKFFFCWGFLFFNIINIFKEIFVMLTKLFLLNKTGLLDDIEIFISIKNKIYKILGIEIPKHSNTGLKVKNFTYILVFLFLLFS